MIDCYSSSSFSFFPIVLILNIVYIVRTWSDNVVPLNISSGKLLGGIIFNIASLILLKLNVVQIKIIQLINMQTGNFL
ncbi:MAG: hypothetical protein ACM3VV_00735 [Deltaproteobacteria bacterium]